MARKKALWLEAKAMAETPKTVEQSMHAKLVESAARFLWRECCIVITELTSGAGECPDAIGFKSGGGSIVVEAKASRSDFFADQNKSFRRIPEMAMGEHRYYIVPKGLITEFEVPARWGLIEVQPSGNLHIAKKSSLHEHNKNAEMKLMISTLRRTGTYAPSGVSVKVYTYDTKNRATFGVETI